MTDESVWECIQLHAANVLEVSPGAIPRVGSLADIGANSIDRLEIVTLCLESLGIDVPLIELTEVSDIPTLVAFLREHAADKAE